MDFLNKNNYVKIKLLLLPIISIIFTIITEVIVYSKLYNFISIDRLIITSIIYAFIFLHCIFKLPSIYNFIFKKRYIISLILLVVIVISKYTGSSIIKYNNFVQSEFKSVDFEEVLGKSRTIRSDEWGVNTPINLSQKYNDYKYFNSNLRANLTDVFNIMNSPVKDVLTLAKPFNIGYILFGNEYGLSFWWYARLFALLLTSFELCMIITNNKKLISMCGMILISFSPGIVWWFSTQIVDLLIFGQLAIICINKFMIDNRLKIRIISSLGLFISVIGYLFSIYPPFQIPLAYVFLALFIFIILKNKKIYKFSKKDLIYLVIILIGTTLLLFRYLDMSKETLGLITNTSYPGKRFEVGGNGISLIFSYVFGIFLPYINIQNPCEISSMISFFPIPIILGIIYIIKNKKIDVFITPILIVSIFLSCYTLFTFNDFFAKATLMYMVPSNRVIIPLGIAQIYLLLYVLSNYNIKLNKVITNIIVILLTTIIIYFAIKIAPNYMGILKIVFCTIMIFVVTYFLFNMNKYRNKVIYILILIALISGIAVNPIVKGTKILYNKPISNEINKILNKDNNAIWISENLHFCINNYLVANGVKVINSTNYYPNFDIWKKVFNKEEYLLNYEKFNRYAHLNIVLGKDSTKLELISPDNILLNLNINDINKLNIKYIVTNRNLEIFNNENIKFKNIYSEYNMNIYQVIY